MTVTARWSRQQHQGDPADWPFVPPVDNPFWETDQQLRSAFEDAAIGMSIANLNWGLLRVNEAHCRMLGYTEHELLTTDFRTRIHPDDLAPNDQLRRDLFSGRINSYETERRYIHRDGHLVWCLVTVSLVRDAEGEPQYFVGQMQDITERKRAEESLRQSEQRLARVLASASDGMVIADQDGIVRMVNPATERMTGLAAATLVGRSVFDLPQMVDPDCLTACDAFETAIREALSDGRTVQQIELSFTRQDGTTICTIIDVAPLRDDDSTQEGILLTAHDVTERKLLEQRLGQLALHDALTGLPNRRLFEDRADLALAAAQRSGWSVGMLLIDLNNFKPINDHFGHPAGDRVLIDVAQRLASCLSGEETVARFGGDEFVVLLPVVRDVSDVCAARDRLNCAMQPPQLVNDEPVTVTASIGISIMQSPTDRFSDLFHRADDDMYRTKRDHRAEGS